MSIDTTLRLLTRATGMTVADLATAIPKAGVNTVSAWLKGDKVPGKEQIDALAQCSAFRPARCWRTGEHARSGADQGRTRTARRLSRAQSAPAGRAARGRAQHAAEGVAQMSKLKRKHYESCWRRCSWNSRAWRSGAARRQARGRGVRRPRHRRQGRRDRRGPRAPQPAPVPVAALPKPDEREKTEWYFQRYAAQIARRRRNPAVRPQLVQPRRRGEGDGFASDAQVKAFLQQAPQFEKQLVDDGILLFKYWLCCDQAQQEKRFAERLDDPLKGLEARRSTSRRASSTRPTPARARRC